MKTLTITLHSVMKLYLLTIDKHIFVLQRNYNTNDRSSLLFIISHFPYKLDLEKAGLEEGLDSSGFRGSRDQIANIHWIIEKAREFQKKHLLLLH